MQDPRQAVLDEIADLSRGDLDAVLAYYTDDVYFEDVSVPEPCRNKEEMRDFMAIFYRGFPDLHIEVRNCVAGDGNTVTAEYDLIGTHTGDFVGHPVRITSSACDSAAIRTVRGCCKFPSTSRGRRPGRR